MMPNRSTRLPLVICLTAIITSNWCYGADYFQAAQNHYSQQAWAAALGDFLQVAEHAREDSMRAPAQFYAAECALQLKNYAQAQTLYQQVLNSEAAADFRERATFRLAECQHLAGDLAGALASFQRFVEAYPRDELVREARNQVGEILLESRRYDTAIEAFAYVIEHYPGPPCDRARLGMARGLVALKRYDEVPVTLGQLCQSPNATTAAEAMLLLGRSKYEAGQYDQSLATFRRVYDLKGVDDVTCRARLAAGWALWKSSRLEEVVSEVELLVNNARFAAEYRYLLGMTAYSAKDWPEASKQLGLAADQHDENRAAAIFYSGESALLGGDPKSARAMYTKVLEIEPHSDWADDAMWGLVRAARAGTSEAEVKHACQQLRSQFPDSEYVSQLTLVEAGSENPLRLRDPSTALFEEAFTLERDGRFGGAIAAYQECLANSKEGAFRAEALWRAARLHERLKQYAESRLLYTQLLTEFADGDRAPAALASLAWIEAETGNDAEAAKYYRDLLEKFPQSAQAAEASYWLALAAADEEKGDEAQWQVDWLLDRLNPASHSLSDAESRILGQTLCLQCQLFAGPGKWKDIVELLDGRAVRQFDDAVGARLDFWRAEAALRLNHHAESRERFEDLADRTVGITESWVPMVSLRRAQLASSREDWQEVLELVDKLDRQFPEFELAYECDYLRGRALAGRGEMSAARTAYGHVLENTWAAGTETAAMAQWMIGESYFHQRNYDLARTAYERVIERHHFPEWQARAALQAGKCAELDDNWDAATKYYADATERWRDTKSAHELSARLRWVQQQVAQKQAAIRR